MAYANRHYGVMAPNAMAQMFLHFAFLQLLDVLTTVAFLLNGVMEANPFVRAMMRMADSPVVGLLIVKAVALALALYCWREGRLRLLGWVNYFFAFVVVWNLGALIVSSIRA